MAEKKEKNLDDKTKIISEMGFPSSIKYGSRSRIRSEFLRFLRLAYLLDFIAV
jgi:dynein heavy chain